MLISQEGTGLGGKAQSRDEIHQLRWAFTRNRSSHKQPGRGDDGVLSLVVYSERSSMRWNGKT